MEFITTSRAAHSLIHEGYRYVESRLTQEYPLHCWHKLQKSKEKYHKKKIEEKKNRFSQDMVTLGGYVRASSVRPAINELLLF